eukprot:1371268-Alexandrium_andersonii.AAC.1
MSASLVGSEMCIRDRTFSAARLRLRVTKHRARARTPATTCGWAILSPMYFSKANLHLHAHPTMDKIR